jgi:hypothetical protein
MKKQLLAIAAMFVGLGAFAQDYYYFKFTGTTSEYVMNQSGSTTILNGPATASLSPEATIPFTWNFYGQPVTKFKASTAGYITFDVSQTASVQANTALSNAAAPNNSIFAFWDDTKLAPVTQNGNTFPSDIRTWTYGTAPNRVFVIQWRLIQTSASTSPTNITYYAIRLYENNNNALLPTFDIIHNYGFGTFSASAGTKNADGSSSKEITGTPNMNFGGNDGQYDASLSAVYKFYYGIQPDNDPELTSISLPAYSPKNSNVSIKGLITNYGKTSLSSFKLKYAVDGGAEVTMQLSGLNIAPNGGTYAFTHNAPYSTPNIGTKNIVVSVSDPNAGVDGDLTNNSKSGSFTIVNSTVPRKVLHEIFTSSTCPPCRPGNENLKAVLDFKVGDWTTIKYQVNFPGTGDPYYTSEVGSRFSYYGANFAPWLTIDGSNNWGAASANANSYTEAMFDAKKAVPSLVAITANYTLSGKAVTVSGNVTPVQGFTNSNLKLRIAIVEKITSRNVKNNGETEFNAVMKKMLPNATGTTISLAAGTAVPYTQTFTFPGNYRLPADGQAANIINLATENSVEEFGNLYAIVFLQDDADKTVWQSETSTPLGPMSVTEINELGLNVYPNPTKGNFMVTFGGTHSNGTVRILDMNGKEVLTQEVNSLNGEINCDNLSNGLYVVELTVAGKTATKKLNIVR